jgi:hypothetical protein
MKESGVIFGSWDGSDYNNIFSADSPYKFVRVLKNIWWTGEGTGGYYAVKRVESECLNILLEKEIRNVLYDCYINSPYASPLTFKKNGL